MEVAQYRKQIHLHMLTRLEATLMSAAQHDSRISAGAAASCAHNRHIKSVCVQLQQTAIWGSLAGQRVLWADQQLAKPSAHSIMIIELLQQ